MSAKKIIATILLIFLFSTTAKSQECSVLGQTPATAFPVCGTNKFYQATVPICSTHDIDVPGCANVGYHDFNPFWYRFTCFESGTLGFLVTPNDLGDDYDWQLYDITGHNPEDVFTFPGLVVTGNWSGTYGVTGARNSGSSSIECASDPVNNQNSFAAMPSLIKDHVYLLLISHFTSTQSGYSLSFAGGTANITDPTLPGLKDLTVNCQGDKLIMRLTKKMKCASLAADGSDFSINAPGASIVSAEAEGCRTGFDMDSLTITLNKPLLPGNYSVSIQEGNDENSLLDNCDNALKDGIFLPVTVLPKAPTPFDSIAPVTCAPQTIELVFKKAIRCSSIAPDGSDFSITGTHPVTIVSAYGDCSHDSVSHTIFVQFAQPITQEGSYTIATKTGLDGNTIVDECGEITPALQSVTFSVKDTVSALFDAKLNYGCLQDTILVSHDGNGSVNNWQWTLSDGIHRNTQTSKIIYDSYGEKTISLAVSNGFCADTASKILNLDNELKAVFALPNLACPNDPVIITDTSVGNIISYRWNFGNGSRSPDKAPLPQTYPQSGIDRRYNIQLIVENNLHCLDTLSKQIDIVYSCHIAVPTAFTPNGDGINDYLYPLNAYKADNLSFSVYNRLGQLIFKTNDRTKKWDGTYNGQPQQPGTFVWMLRYTHHDTKQLVSMYGTSVLIR